MPGCRGRHGQSASRRQRPFVRMSLARPRLTCPLPTRSLLAPLLRNATRRWCPSTNRSVTSPRCPWRKAIFDAGSLIPSPRYRPRSAEVLPRLRFVLVPYLEGSAAEKTPTKTRRSAGASRGEMVAFRRPAAKRQLLAHYLNEADNTFLFLAVENTGSGRLSLRFLQRLGQPHHSRT